MNPVEPERNLPDENGKVKSALGEKFSSFFRRRARDPRINGAAFKVYCILLADCDGNGCSSTTLDKIEKESGHSRHTILRAITELEKADWIAVDRYESLGYLTPPNVYHILNLPPECRNCTPKRSTTWRYESDDYKPRLRLPGA